MESGLQRGAGAGRGFRAGRWPLVRLLARAFSMPDERHSSVPKASAPPRSSCAASATDRGANYRCGAGEVDLIALDRCTVVFIEVKTRTQPGFGTPFEAVDRRKQRQIQRAAQQYISENRLHARDARFDVVGVWWEDGRLRWSWLESLRGTIGRISGPGSLVPSWNTRNQKRETRTKNSLLVQRREPRSAHACASGSPMRVTACREPARRPAAVCAGETAPGGGIVPGSPGVHAGGWLAASAGAGSAGGSRGRERVEQKVETVEQVVGVGIAEGHRAQVPLRLDQLEDRRVVVHHVRD